MVDQPKIPNAEDAKTIAKLAKLTASQKVKPRMPHEYFLILSLLMFGVIAFDFFSLASTGCVAIGASRSLRWGMLCGMNASLKLVPEFGLLTFLIVFWRRRSRQEHEMEN